jgi:hypothetical protein
VFRKLHGRRAVCPKCGVGVAISEFHATAPVGRADFPPQATPQTEPLQPSLSSQFPVGHQHSAPEHPAGELAAGQRSQ